MKTIGFVDYYISEWHADNYPAWIKETCEKCGFDYKLAYAWALKDVSEVDGLTTAEWCKKFGVEKCETAKELCEKSDYIVILAPSDPEKHLELAKATFPYAAGKRFYIDKTFAPDLKTAKEIYALAEKYGINFFSTSALRYADEIENYRRCERAESFGGGGNFDEYIIHQAEMIVKTMGTDIRRAKTTNTEKGNDCMIVFSDGRTAEMHYNCGFGFKMILTANGKENEIEIRSDFFKNLIKNILAFFENGQVDFDETQTLAVMALREAVIRSKNENGEWIEL